MQNEAVDPQRAAYLRRQSRHALWALGGSILGLTLWVILMAARGGHYGESVAIAAFAIAAFVIGQRLIRQHPESSRRILACVPLLLVMLLCPWIALRLPVWSAGFEQPYSYGTALGWALFMLIVVGIVAHRLYAIDSQSAQRPHTRPPRRQL